MHSSIDTNIIRELMREGKLFCKVHDHDARRRIEHRIVECSRIMTLKSFIEDSRYLKPSADGLYKLLPKEDRGKRILRKNFKHYFKSDEARFLNQYIDLCLDSQRDFEHCSQGKFSNVLKSKGQSTPIIKPRNMQKLGQLAYRAKLKGFRTQQIDELIAQAEKPFVFESIPLEAPEQGGDNHTLPKDSRSNRPDKTSYDRECKYLFLENVSRHPETQPKAYPTYFAVMRDVALRFWPECSQIEPESPAVRTEDDQCRLLAGLQERLVR